MNPLSVLDVVTSVNVGQVTELDSQVVSGDCDHEKSNQYQDSGRSRFKVVCELTLVQGDLALVDFIRRETDEDGILSLLSTDQSRTNQSAFALSRTA
jgi:hypothetical protein